MNTVKCKIAGFNIEIETDVRVLKEILRDYLADFSKADATISICEDDINFEKEIVEEDIPIQYETTYKLSAIHRKIGEWLPLKDAFVLHSACFDVEGVGVAFAAHSGTGKSTHMMRWMEYLGNKMTVVNGDKPIVRFLRLSQNDTNCHTEEQRDEVSRVDSCACLRMTGECAQNDKTDETLPNIPYAYGTPWNGKEGLGCNMRTTLKHICFIERSDTNYAERLDKENAIQRIFGQVYMPQDPMAVVKTLGLIDRLLCSCDLWIIHCNMDENAGEIVYKQIFES